MAHPTFVPKRTFFYPIGNTSPICLTQDIAPEKSASILLLGFGDPRNILYTLYASGADETSLQRILDFTCCDLDPAVLARNYVLFTLLIDDKVPLDHIWNIFYDFYLKLAPFEALSAHCRKLVELSKDIESWRAGRYGHILKFCTQHTLTEVRKHWAFYADFKDLPDRRKADVQTSFRTGMKDNQVLDKTIMSVGRAAGPLFTEAMMPTSKHFTHFWRTGIHSVDPQDLKDATRVNPTFAYSGSREGFHVHYGTDGLAAFHLAPAFASLKSGPAPSSDPIGAAVAVAKSQFQDWCKAFTAAANGTDSLLVIRVFAGDALAFCNALHYYSSGGPLVTPVYTMPWKSSLITLDSGDYDGGASPQAPKAFDVIDTSNLMDHLGLLNVLVAIRPLLAARASTTLYTEALLPVGSNAVSRFAENLCGDMNAVCLLLDLAPSAYLSKFTTASNVHEILMYRVFRHGGQFHERVSWKIPSLVDQAPGVDPSDARVGLRFQPEQLASLLSGIYYKMFSDEDVLALRGMTPEELKSTSLIHYCRASFALLLRAVKSKVQVDWERLMDELLDLIEQDRRLLVGSNNVQDLYCHLHLLDVFHVGTVLPDNRIVKSLLPSSMLPGWKNVPPVLSVSLVIPRKRLQKLEKADPQKLGTPLLVCETKSASGHNFFSSLHLAFGTLKKAGAGEETVLSLEEDVKGWSGSSDLVVWFWIPTFVLLHAPSSTNIGLSIRSTPQSMMMTRVLGMDLGLFSTSLLDRSHVFVARDHPNPPGELDKVRGLSFPSAPGNVAIDVQLIKSREVATLSRRLDIVDQSAQEVLSSGVAVSEDQVSPCGIQVTFGDIHQVAYFPFPVDGTKARLRIARKSHYIEVLAAPAGSHSPGGLLVNPFPVLLDGTTPTLWNMHRLYLDRQPALDATKKSSLDRWLNTHVSLSLSDREKAMRSGGGKSNQDPFQALVDVKESLHALYMRFTGLQGDGAFRVFGLSEPDMGGIYTLLFITDLRLDLAAHTAVLDAFALPLTTDRVSDLGPLLRRLEQTGGGVVQVVTKDNEMRAWKRLLPAAAERCRRTWTHAADCAYVRAGGRVPLSTGYAANPLCACGEGKDIAPFRSVAAWADAAPFVTRMALSPLFAVSYLESVAGEADAIGESLRGGASSSSSRASTSGQNGSREACGRCGKAGTGAKPLLVCGRCKGMRYCSAECQRADWKSHKVTCSR